MPDPVNQKEDLPLPTGCSNPSCNCKGPLTMHSACHSGAPTWVVLVGNVLLLRCAVCGDVTAGFRVTGLTSRMETKACLALVESSQLEVMQSTKTH